MNLECQNLLFWVALVLSLSRIARYAPSFRGQIASKTAAFYPFINFNHYL